MEDQASVRMRENADAANKDEVTPMSPSSPKDKSKVKNWLKTKFARRQSRGQKSPTDKEKDADTGFIGGAALRSASANNSTTSLGAKSSSIRDVATAGTTSRAAEPEPSPISDVDQTPDTDIVSEEDIEDRSRRESQVSAVSRDEDEFQEARDNFDEDLAPPPTFVAGKGTSPVRAGKFTEEI